MRDAILQADANRGLRDRDRIWAVFAARGMGENASTFGDGDTSPVEGFNAPPPLPPETPGGTSTPDTVAPSISRFSMSRRRFRVGPNRTPRTARRVERSRPGARAAAGRTASPARRSARGSTFRFRLSERATVRIALERGRPGRRGGPTLSPPVAPAPRPSALHALPRRRDAHPPRPHGWQKERLLQRPRGSASAAPRPPPLGHLGHRRRRQPLAQAKADLHDRPSLSPSATTSRPKRQFSRLVPSSDGGGVGVAKSRSIACRMRPDIQVLDDPAAVACDLLAAASGHVALTGGSTPRRAYERVAAVRSDWSDAEIWFSDERCVAPDHEHSNYRMVADALIDRVHAGPVHRMRGELGPDDGAADYERELREAFDGARPVFDLFLVGLGADAHICSLFPGDDALGGARPLRRGCGDARDGAARAAHHAHPPRGERRSEDRAPRHRRGQGGGCGAQLRRHPGPARPARWWRARSRCCSIHRRPHGFRRRSDPRGTAAAP